VSSFPIVIEKGIPIPPAAKRVKGKSTKINLKHMEIGDSFVIPFRKTTGLYSYAKSMSLRILVRYIDDTNVRVWRME
jgi:hypothetical protein